MSSKSTGSIIVSILVGLFFVVKIAVKLKKYNNQNKQSEYQEYLSRVEEQKLQQEEALRLKEKEKEALLQRGELIYKNLDYLETASTSSESGIRKLASKKKLSLSVGKYIIFPKNSFMQSGINRFHKRSFKWQDDLVCFVHEINSFDNFKESFISARNDIRIESFKETKISDKKFYFEFIHKVDYMPYHVFVAAYKNEEEYLFIQFESYKYTNTQLKKQAIAFLKTNYKEKQ